jgi:hypothetical protein
MDRRTAAALIYIVRSIILYPGKVNKTNSVSQNIPHDDTVMSISSYPSNTMVYPRAVTGSTTDTACVTQSAPQPILDIITSCTVHAQPESGPTTSQSVRAQLDGKSFSEHDV